MSTHLAMGSTDNLAMEKSTPGTCQEEVEESRGAEMNKSWKCQKLNMYSTGLPLFVCY